MYHMHVDDWTGSLERLKRGVLDWIYQRAWVSDVNTEFDEEVYYVQCIE